MSDAQEGYQPKQPSVRDFFYIGAVFALLMAVSWLLDDYIGHEATVNLLRLGMSVVFVISSIRIILNPRRAGDFEPRNARLLGVASLIFFTVLGALSTYDLFFPE